WFQQLPVHQFVDDGQVVLSDLPHEQSTDILALLDVFDYIQQAFEVNCIFGKPATTIYPHGDMEGNLVLKPIFFGEHVKRIGKRIPSEHMLHGNDPSSQYAHAVVGKSPGD